MMLSDNFSLEEMVLSETASRMGYSNKPTQEIVQNLTKLAGVLERVRELLGRPLIITSGYRNPVVNTAIGGSSNSAHMLGLAADFISPPKSPIEICKLIAASDIDFDQLIHEHTWVHFAIGPQQRRQVLGM